MNNSLPITLQDFEKEWNNIKIELEEFKCSNFEFIGSTGKKELMGDIDIAVNSFYQRNELFEIIKQKYGSNNVAKIGSNIVSFNHIYDINKTVQIDLMIGDTLYLKWARCGSSTIKNHKDYSNVKGFIRNILLNTITKYTINSNLKQQSDLDRIRHIIDFDCGLYKVTQTKRSKLIGRSPTKEWKTITKQFISNNPDEIVKIIFGENYCADNLRTFENVIDAIKTSSIINPFMNIIFEDFIINIKKCAIKTPTLFEDNVDYVIQYVKNHCSLIQ